jgi:hypothetical protein
MIEFDAMRASVYGGADMRVLTLALLALGCSSQTGPSISLKIAHDATGDGRCGVAGAQDPAVTSLSSISHIRLTWRGHKDNDPTGSFLCDRVLKVGETPNLRLHVSSLKSFDLFAEGFADAAPGDPDNGTHGTFRRVATGALLNVPFNSKTFPTLRMYQVQNFGCVAAKMSRARSWHSATPLPNGHVLLVGGAVAGSDPATEDLSNNLYYLTGGAEIYDPADGSFKPVAEDNQPSARAFHQAFYLGTDGTGAYQILLVGGVASTNEALAALGITNSGLGGPRLVPFDTSQTIPSPLPTVAAPAEILSFDPSTLHITRWPASGINPVAFVAGVPLGTPQAPDGFVVAGGVNYVDPLNTLQPATSMGVSVQRGAETMPRYADLAAGRLGASLSVVDADRALVWGGVLTGSAAQASVLSGLTAGGTVAVNTLGLPGVTGTQFQTTSLVSSGADSQFLVTGGFAVDDLGNASQPPSAADAVHLVTLAADGSLSIAAVPFGTPYVPDSSTCTNGSRYRPAGWESAITLPLGRGVLITGGAPTFDQARKCNDCDSGSSFLCSLRQASSYPMVGGNFNPGPSQLQVGRFGHASTLLSDGTVLITGGTTLAPGGTSPRISPDGEVFNPHTQVPPYNSTDAAPIDLDDPIAADLVNGLSRAPGQLAQMGGHAAARCDDLN